MRVAIVHEWLTGYAGSERVLEGMLEVLPEADLFSVADFLRSDERGFLRGKTPRTSFIQRLPLARTKYRHYLALMPLAVEQLDVSGYDLVISSSHAVAKGVLTGPDQLHLCMCYSPIRYAWDLQHQYLRGAGLTKGLRAWIVRAILHYVRLWDARTAHGVDRFIAISHFVAGRIRKAYRRESTVIYPPVDVEAFTPPGPDAPREDFYLAASRMVPYKRMDLIAEAFSRMPDRRLVILGDGPDFRKVRRRAGPNVTLLGYQPRDVLIDHLRRAAAFVFAAEEDFGIVPVEAQACGTPVIAYGRGGATETVLPDQTGVLFGSHSPEDLIEAVRTFESKRGRFDPGRIRANAERFSRERFGREFGEFVRRQWAEFQAGRFRAPGSPISAGRSG